MTSHSYALARERPRTNRRQVKESDIRKLSFATELSEELCG